MKRPTISRRAFLAAAGLSAAGLSLPTFLRHPGLVRSAAAQEAASLPGSQELAFSQPRKPAGFPKWGRTTTSTPIRETPGLNQPLAAWLYPDTVLPLFEEIHAEGNNPNNTLWYRVDGGYIYTSTVQPIAPYRTPDPIDVVTTLIGEELGAWAQLIVPYSSARVEPSGAIHTFDLDEETKSPVIIHYGSMHRIIDVEFDGAGYRWYKILDDKPKTKPFYILARHLRVMKEHEFAPINPGADKRLVADMTAQRIDCFEGDTLVFSTLTSSGGDGFETPLGEHAVVYKQASRHMYSDPEQEAFSDPDFFDLPGVPFNVFFTTMGHAIHGTYWHGDYGRPRSHGCLNVTPEAAFWLFRWLEPFSPYISEFSGSSAEPGTPVIVV